MRLRTGILIWLMLFASTYGVFMSIYGYSFTFAMIAGFVSVLWLELGLWIMKKVYGIKLRK